VPLPKVLELRFADELVAEIALALGHDNVARAAYFFFRQAPINPAATIIAAPA